MLCNSLREQRVRFSAKVGWRLGAFGDPGSRAEKVTTGLAPSLAQTPTKNRHKSQPQQEAVTLRLSAFGWVLESQGGRAAPWKKELDNECSKAQSRSNYIPVLWPSLYIDPSCDDLNPVSQKCKYTPPCPTHKDILQTGWLVVVCDIWSPVEAFMITCH